MREILVYDDYEIHKLGAGGGTQYEEVTTEKSTRIDVTDVAKPKGKLIPFGRTEQVQLSGKNKANPTNIINGSFTTKEQIESNSEYSNVGDGKYRILRIENLPAGTYTFTIFWKDTARMIRMYRDGIIQSIANDSNSYTFTTNRAGLFGIQFRNSTTTAFTDDDYNLQLEEGSSSTSYEQYCGEEPSPRPDMPQPIENVEGRSCRNLIDYTTVQSTYQTSVELIENGFKVLGKYAGQIVINNLKTNTDYYLQYIRENIVGTSERVGIFAGTTQSSTIKNLYRSGTFNTGENTTINIWFYISTDGEANFTNIQLNEGSTALPYEPYFEGKRLEFNLSNKNLIEVNDNNFLLTNVTGYTNASYNKLTGDIDITGKALLGIKCKVNPNTQYTVQYLLKQFSATSGQYNIRVRECEREPFAYGDEYIVQSVDVKKDYSSELNPKATFTTSSNTEWIILIFYNNVTTTGIVTNWCVSEGTDTTYVEHKQQTIPFPLAEGQKLMQGDYLANDGIHHVRGKMNVSNYINWSKSANSNEETCLFSCDTGISGGSLATNIAKNCNRFICRSVYYSHITNEGIHLQKNNGKLFIRIKNDRLTDTTIQAFIDWLSLNEVILEYELIEETIDPYTPAQAEAYNKLMNLKLYQGVNHIWTNTDGLEPNLQLTYKRKKQSNVLQVSNVQPLNNLELNNIEETPEEIITEISEE